MVCFNTSTDTVLRLSFDDDDDCCLVFLSDDDDDDDRVR